MSDRVVRSRLHILIREYEIKHKEAGLSLRRVALRAGVSYATLKAFARDELTCYPAHTLARLCEFFECDIGDLLQVTKEE